MLLQELKDFLNTLDEEQLKQQVVIFNEDDETPLFLDSWEVSDCDIYWEHHGDCLGPLEEAKAFLGEDWEIDKEDLIVVPKGAVTFSI